MQATTFKLLNHLQHSLPLPHALSATRWIKQHHESHVPPLLSLRLSNYQADISIVSIQVGRPSSEVLSVICQTIQGSVFPMQRQAGSRYRNDILFFFVIFEIIHLR